MRAADWRGARPGPRRCGAAAAARRPADSGHAAQSALTPAKSASAACLAASGYACSARPGVQGVGHQAKIAAVRPCTATSCTNKTCLAGKRGTPLKQISRARSQSPIGLGPVSSESAIMEVRMRRRYSFTDSGRLRAVPAASTSIMAMKTSRDAEGL